MVNTILLVILSFAGGFLVAFVTSSLIWDPDDRYDKEATYRERKIPASEIREECEIIDEAAADEHEDGFRAGMEYATDRFRERWDL